MTQEDRPAGPGVTALASVFLALSFALSVVRFIDADEIEHLHSTWHVLGGALPYVDFFQHHHPLLWYCLAPILAITGQSASAFVAFRLVFFLVMLATVWAAYRLALECRASHDGARLAVLLLLSLTTFVYAAIEIRPDVPQTLFGVLSVLYLVRVLRTGAPRDAVISGVCAALAFVFLQKAVFVLVFYPLVFGAHMLRRRVSWHAGAVIAGAFVAVCLPFLAWLVATHSLDDYVLTNWLLGARVPAGRARFSYLAPTVLRDFARNAVFLGLALGMTIALARRRLRADYAVPAVFGIGTIAVLFVLNRVVDRYLVAAMPFLAVAVGLWLAGQFERRRIRGLRMAAWLLVICLAPGAAMARAVFHTNHGQLAQIQYVLDHSSPGDRMYDDTRDFNLFRPDMHYFWFMSSPGVRLYNGLTGGRFTDYDECRLIDTVEPRFVSNRQSVLERCGLADEYRPTMFGRMVERAAK